MRICLYNPQTVLGDTLLYKLLGKSKARGNIKYDFILDFLFQEEIKSAIVVDGTASSLTAGSSAMAFLSNNFWLMRIISFFEIYIWCFINNISPLKVKIIFDHKKLNSSEDVLFGFAFLTETFSSKKMTERSSFKHFSGKKMLHASHIFSKTRKIAENVKNCGVTLMVSESDLKKSSFFNNFFPFIDKIYVLPFALRSRYVKKKDFYSRKNKCMAIGKSLKLCENIDNCPEDFYEYANFFQTNLLQPMRQLIYEQKRELENYLESYISVQEPADNKLPKKKDSFFKKIYNLCSPIFFRKKDKYYNFDIIEAYNDYRMFICPEEKVDVPSINFIEGMACGCAYIGIDHSMYKDIGMIDGQNYIAYDGTLEGMKSKIDYYKNHPEKLAQIAQSGFEFVRDNFSKEKIVKNFLNNI